MSIVKMRAILTRKRLRKGASPLELRDRTFGTVVLEQRLADGRLAYTEYTHLDISKVTYGQVVHAGEVIGQSGARGKEGPRHYPAHLHYAEWLGAVGGGNKSTGMPQFTKWEGHEEGKPVNRGHPVNYADRKSVV